MISMIIAGVIKALKNNGILFTIVDNAKVHDGGHGSVGVVLAQEGSCQADSLLARRHGGADLTHSTCWQRVGKDRPYCQNLQTMLFVAAMSPTFPTTTLKLFMMQTTMMKMRTQLFC